jgi:hypothetical protein
LHLPIRPGRTLWELTRLPNTIYAQAGNTFGKKWLADYFNVGPWYRASPAIRREQAHSPRSPKRQSDSKV